jgi:hypothetical protein
MSIRFNCTACQTVLKIGEAISEPRKVRCTGCGIVIVLTPDEDSPIGMTVSVPQQSGKAKDESKADLARQRNMLIGGAVVAGLILVLGAWWLFSGPSDRGTVEGEVTVDGAPLEKGTIRFSSLDQTKPLSATGEIKQGHYRLPASQGPMIGPNRVEIHGERNTGKQVLKPNGTPGEMIEEIVEAVAAKYNTKSELKFDVRLGTNTKDFPVTSR